jgi:hypothetical protein
VSVAQSRLGRLARRSEQPPVEPVEEERCDLCGEPVPPEHRHLIDVNDRRLLCACRPCSILFAHSGAGGGHYRLLPDEVRYLVGFDLDDALWRSLDIPVDLAFLFHSSAAGRVVAFYPAPAGATESLLDLAAWTEVVERNLVLRDLEPDVEALLVDRTGAEHAHWLVPVDRCYELVGLMRTYWKGFGGGRELREQLDAFFARLRRGARAVTKDGKETVWDSRTT